MKSVALHNLGCKVNGYEMDVMQQKLSENGFLIVPFDTKADIYIVNTCTVTNIADHKSRQMLHKARSLNPDAIVVGVGCYIQTDLENVLKDEAVDLCIGNNRKKDITSILTEYIKQKEELKNVGADKTLGGTTVIDINHTSEYEEMTLKKTAEHTRAYIKIQDGCNQFCSYCLIPYARGRIRSREEEDILSEVKGIAEAGYKEIVLTGIHISSYGVDRGEPELLRLLSKLQDIDGIRRIRLGSLEPRIVTEEFAREIGQMDKICPHFHLSLQSGCDDTLKRMNRHYTSGEFYEGVERLRANFEHPAITTDVIVGFPGETDEEFEISKQFLEKVKFYEMHVFKYSKRKGTNAAKMDNQISEAVKGKRSAALISLDEVMSTEFRKFYRGKSVEVLYEESKRIDGKVCQIGHTREYLTVAKQEKNDKKNEIFYEKVSNFMSNGVIILE